MCFLYCNAAEENRNLRPYCFGFGAVARSAPGSSVRPGATAAAAKKKVPTSPRNGRKRFELAAGSKGYVKLPPSLAHFSSLDASLRLNVARTSSFFVHRTRLDRLVGLRSTARLSFSARGLTQTTFFRLAIRRFTGHKARYDDVYLRTALQ